VGRELAGPVRWIVVILCFGWLALKIARVRAMIA
jgi:hypothetical protein